jgi:MFS family permease
MYPDFVMKLRVKLQTKGGFKMSENSNKIRNVLIVATLSLSTIAMMGDMVIIPVAENLFTDFHDVNMGLLNYLLSGPALISAFSSLLCGKLMSYIGKKKLLAASFVFFMTGSICGDLVHNAYYMAGMRSLVGVGMGAVMVLAIAIISDVFVDEKARSSVMGIYNGMMAGVGAILGWVSGMVAAVEWTLVFRIYLASIPIFLMILIFVPENKPVKPGQETGSEGDAEKMPWSKLLLMDGAFFVYSTIYCIIYYQISMVITDKSIGDVTFIGILSALGTVGSFLCCCFFGLYYAKFKRFTPFVGFAGLALGFFLLFIAQGSVMAAIGCVLLGGMFGLGITYYMMRCTMIVPPSQIPMSISVTTFIMALGTFLSTYVSLALQRLMNTSITGIIPPLCAVLALGAVLSVITALKERKTAPEPVA